MMKLIKTTVLDTAAASVTIDNIPQQFKCLKLIMSIKSDNASYEYIGIQWNGSGTNQTGRFVGGNGSTTQSGTDLNSTFIKNSQTYARLTAYYLNSNLQTSNTFTSYEMIVPNYSLSVNKSFIINWVSESNTATANYANQEIGAGLWSNSAAITSITLSPSNSNFVAGSTFYLYGIG